jgi:NADH-quinone oxidoreductase subunit J
MQAVVFYSLAGLTILTAVCVVSMRNVFHSALMLGLSLAGVAGIFASLGADFLFAAQILIYVSGIAVLILFVVLLSGRASDFVLRQVNEQWAGAAVLCGVLLGAFYAIFEPFRDRVFSAPRATTFELGKILLNDYGFPFELISVVLLVAILGAMVFSEKEPEGAEPK